LFVRWAPFLWLGGLEVEMRGRRLDLLFDHFGGGGVDGSVQVVCSAGKASYLLFWAWSQPLFPLSVLGWSTGRDAIAIGDQGQANMGVVPLLAVQRSTRVVGNEATKAC
jgi:hypothetical protein